MTEKRGAFELHTKLFEPTEQEQSILRSQERIVSFEVLHPFGISEGRQSRVSVLEYSVGGQRDKVIWKRMGAGKGLTHTEALSLERRIFPYRETLMGYGWSVPPVFFHKAIEIEGEGQIFSYEKMVEGGDAGFMVANPKEPNFRKWFVVKTALSILAGHKLSELERVEILGKEVSRLPYGIDLKLENLVLSREGTLFFVDSFCPKELNAAGDWLTYSTKLDLLPVENLKAVTATREGTLLRLYRMAEQRWAKAGIETPRLRSDFLESITASDLPEQEKKAITAEVESNFPWLDKVYNERDV